MPFNFTSKPQIISNPSPWLLLLTLMMIHMSHTFKVEITILTLYRTNFDIDQNYMGVNNISTWYIAKWIFFCVCVRANSGGFLYHCQSCEIKSDYIQVEAIFWLSTRPSLLLASIACFWCDTTTFLLANVDAEHTSTTNHHLPCLYHHVASLLEAYIKLVYSMNFGYAQLYIEVKNLLHTDNDNDVMSS